MFKTRLLSGIVLVVVLIVTVGYGNELLFAFTGAISLIGMKELYQVVGVQNRALGMAGYLAALFYYSLLWVNHMEYMTMLSILFLVAVMAVYAVSYTHLTLPTILLV